jgi:hypothetical protein
MTHRTTAVVVGAAILSMATLLLAQTSDRENAAPAAEGVPVRVVDVRVGPAAGAVPIPPADVPSDPYEVVVTVQGAGGGGLTARLVVYAGGIEQRTVTRRGDRLEVEARIDDAGEQATVTGDFVADGEPPLRLTSAVWLPPDHVYQRPSPTPR